MFSVGSWSRWSRPALPEVEMMVGASDRGLEIGDEDIELLDDLQVTGLAGADDDSAVFGHHRPSGEEARLAVGD